MSDHHNSHVYTPTLVTDLLHRLYIQAASNPIKSKQAKHFKEWYLKEQLVSRGMHNPQIERTVDAWYSANHEQFENLTLADDNVLIQDLFQSGVYDQQYACVFYIYKYRQRLGHFGLDILDELESVFDQGHVRTWNVSDSIGNTILRKMVDVYGKAVVQKISDWSGAENEFKVRASCITFYVRPKCLNDLECAAIIWDICANLVSMESNAMKLRSKQLLMFCNFDQLELFIQSHINFIPYSVLQEICAQFSIQNPEEKCENLLAMANKSNNHIH